jgi:hypothetical protein
MAQRLSHRMEAKEVRDRQTSMICCSLRARESLTSLM